MRNESGFTLVEMLVALSIFALLSAAGVTMLRSSVDTQAAVDERLTELGAAGRLHALLASDLGQAVDRTTRGPGGDRPAFSGEASGMRLVRAGWSNIDDAARSDLQRVEWRAEQGSLVRVGQKRLDGSDDGQPAVLARSIASAAFRYRNLDGSWSALFLASEQRPLPTAVEVTLTPKGSAPVVMVFALPDTADRSPPVPAA